MCLPSTPLQEHRSLKADFDGTGTSMPPASQVPGSVNSRMKQRRPVRTLLLMLAAGAAVNVLVTWGTLLVGRQVDPQPTSPLVIPPVWPAWGSSDWLPPDQHNRIDTWWARIDKVIPTVTGESLPPLGRAYEGVLGWPMRSMGWRCVDWFVVGEDRAQRELRYGWRLPGTNSFSTSVLPLRPLWPGFAVNTVFYAAITALLWAVPRQLQKWRRRQRGVCEGCAYPRSGLPPSTPCPECGAMNTPA